MGNSKLRVGDKFNLFELPDQDGKLRRISPDDGKKRIIYFYPKDGTRVCTEQACSVRDSYEEFTEAGYEVIGISADSSSSHQRFIAGNNLNFMLLSDVKGVVRKQFGATHLFGLIPGRKTFVINGKGIIEFEYEAMFEGKEHFEKVKEFLNNKL